MLLAAELALVLILGRPLELAAYDPGYAEAADWSLARIDLAMMGAVLVVTVVGLKVVGPILIVALSLPRTLIGICNVVASALPGNFSLLRRPALISDAICRVVLPGIVVAFLFTGAVATDPMLLGAEAAAVRAVVAIEAIRRLGRIEAGAAMGVVFTAMFDGGVLLLE